jgi:hypothetical protein
MDQFYPQHYVVLTPRHAQEIPELRSLVGNIVEFMTGDGGNEALGAVLVKLTKPRRYGGPVGFEILRVDNGPDAARRTGWNVPDFERSKFALVAVGGRITKPVPPAAPSPPPPKMAAPPLPKKKAVAKKVANPKKKSRTRAG